MKKALAWMLGLALTAAIAVGGTFAYLSDTDEDVNVMTIGKVKIDQLEFERVDVETADQNAVVQEFHDNKPLYPAVIKDGFDWTPGDSYVDWERIGKDGYTSDIWDPSKINNEVDKMVFVKNKGDYDAYVRNVFAFEAGKYTTLDEFQKMVHLNLNITDWTWNWNATPVTIGESTYFVAAATYNKVLEPGALTEISLSQIALDPTATNEDVEAFGDTYQVLVKTQAIQADGFDNPVNALNDGFGFVVSYNIPWENDQPIKGIDVRTALHYENGSASKKITGTVTNVIFGLNKDYPNIVDNYDGTLVDVEQDVDVYSYYVNDGRSYTVYFLANDTIYCPKDSNGLFRDMKKLVDVDMGNLDVSRVETMRNMFRSCEVLPTLDTTAWDTSNVKDMAYMFLNNFKLKEIKGTENWNTSKVTTMLQTFAFCKVIKEINCANWDVSNVTNMMGMFGQCFALEGVDATGWKPVNVTNTQNMFYNGYALKSVVGSEKWEMPNNTTTYSMFQNCYELEYINASQWDLSNVTNMQAMFFTCKKLTEVEGSEKWNTGNVTTMKGMFENCFALNDLDVGTWDVSNVTSFSFTFRGCESLEMLDVSQWDTGNVKEFNSMFSSYDQNTFAMKLKELPVENWDVSSATNMGWMFYGNGQLKELDLSKWDVSNVTTMYHMFTDCRQIEHIDFAGWDTSKVTTMDGMFNNCESLKIVDLSPFDTQNVTSLAQLFDGAYSLEQVIGLEYFDTSNCTAYWEMFTGTKLTELNLSSFDTSNAVNTSSMFSGSGLLKTIYVGDGWDMSNVTSSGGMFGGCSSLVGGNGTTFRGSDLQYAHVDGGEEDPGYLTHINDRPVDEPTA